MGSTKSMSSSEELAGIWENARRKKVWCENEKDDLKREAEMKSDERRSEKSSGISHLRWCGGGCFVSIGVGGEVTGEMNWPLHV